jgi:hypothetical protein
MNSTNIVNLEIDNYWALIHEIGSYNNKWDDSVATKAEIFRKLIDSLNPNAKSVLFTGFNPIALYFVNYYDVSIVCSDKISGTFNLDKIEIYPTISTIDKKFDIVIALDEYFTYAPDEFHQRFAVEQIAKRTNSWLITTLQDYKNFAPHKKNQIEGISIKNSNNYIVLESSISDKLDKQVWEHYWLCIKNFEMTSCLGPRTRRTMYFKQLAKYASDAGAKQYVIQKNLLYKGFFSKNFEHIITVNF